MSRRTEEPWGKLKRHTFTRIIITRACKIVLSHGAEDSLAAYQAVPINRYNVSSSLNCPPRCCQLCHLACCRYRLDHRWPRSRKNLNPWHKVYAAVGIVLRFELYIFILLYTIRTLYIIKQKRQALELMGAGR